MCAHTNIVAATTLRMAHHDSFAADVVVDGVDHTQLGQASPGDSGYGSTGGSSSPTYQLPQANDDYTITTTISVEEVNEPKKPQGEEESIQELLLQQLGIGGRWPKHLYLNQPPKVSLDAKNVICAECGKIFVNGRKFRTHFRDIHQAVQCGFCLATKSEKTCFLGYSSYHRHAVHEDCMPRRYKKYQRVPK